MDLKTLLSEMNSGIQSGQWKDNPNGTFFLIVGLISLVRAKLDKPPVGTDVDDVEAAGQKLLGELLAVLPDGQPTPVAVVAPDGTEIVQLPLGEPLFKILLQKLIELLALANQIEAQ